MTLELMSSDRFVEHLARNLHVFIGSKSKKRTDWTFQCQLCPVSQPQAGVAFTGMAGKDNLKARVRIFKDIDSIFRGLKRSHKDI